MALVLKDRVKQTAAAPGTGTITLGATAAGFQSFSSVGNGNTTYFAIVDPISGAWEVNYGVYTSSGTTLTRNATPLSSSTGTLVNFTGAVDVFVTYPSENAVWRDTAGVVVQQSFGAITATSAALTSGTITGAPVNATDIVNKEYADSIASGLNYHQPVNYASTAALPAYTYNNGTSGVGATITANANGALSLGGGSPTATQRVLIKDEVGGNAPYNGVYVVTQAGTSLLPFILTRATDYDTSGTGTNEIDQGDYVLVISGTLASTAWVQQTPLPITVGTTALTFLQFNAPITYTAGTGLNLSPATTFNISNTGVTATTYGSASAVPVVTFNAQGQATGVTNTTIAITGSQVSGNISGQAGSVANALTLGTYLTGGTYNGSAAVTATVDATSANTASKVVARDSSGNFSAGTITATLSGSSTSATTATNLAGGAANQIAYQSGSGTTTFATAPSASNQVLGWNGSAFSWSTGTISGVPLGSNLNSLTAGTYLTGTAYNGSAAQTWTVNAASANTASTVVARDASGNFSAGTITASLSGNATTTSQTNFSNLTIGSSQVLYAGNYNSYAPTLTGTGASGTWNINVTGSAGSSTSSTYTTYISSISLGTGSANVNYGSSAVLRIDGGSGAYLQYAPLLHVAAGDTMWQAQGSYGTSGDGTLYFRQGYNGSWGNWLIMLSNANYNSYAPTLTGTGASGTWGINITGSAGSAGSVDYANLTNKTGGTGTYTTSGDYRAPIFYDSDNTGYYVNPASTSVLNDVNLVNGKWYTSNNESGQSLNIYVRPNGDNTYVWRHIYGGTGSGYGTGVGGYGIYYQTLGGDYNVIYSPSGFATFPYSARSPIFYDSNNTAYYLDPASTSDTALRMRGGALFGPNTTWGAYLAVGGNGDWNTAYASVATTNGNLHLDASSGSNTYLNYYAGSNVYFGNGASGGIFAQITSDGSFRSPIFYDYANTAYYADLAGTSYLYSLILSGATYFRPNNWIQLDGDYGIYNTVYNGAHFLANNTSTYGAWRMIGSRNSYSGIYDTFSGVNASMYDGSGNGGIYREANGRWYQYYNITNDCTGFGTSSTASAYNIYCPKGIYSGGRVDGTIFYDTYDTGYYVDPNGYSQMYSINAASYVYGGYLSSGSNVYTNANYGYGLIGAYNASRYQGVYAMGDAYKLPPDGTTTGNLYGMAWSHPNAGGAASNLNSHGLLLLQNGGFMAALSTNGTFSADVRGTIFYDYNNTAYYVDPNGSSNVSAMVADNWFRSIGQTGLYSQSYSQHFYPLSNGRYWSITGNGSTDYGGLVFKTTYESTIKGYTYWDTSGFGLLHGGGGWSVRGNVSAVGGQFYGSWFSDTDLRAPIFYDYNDTSYYLNPNSTSSLHSATCWSTWYFRSNTNTSGSNPPLQAYSDNGSGAIMSFHRGGYYAINFGLDSDNVMRLGGWSAPANLLQIDMSGNLTMLANVTAYSDERLKKDWDDLPSDFVPRLARVKSGTYTRIDNEMRQIGVGAQSLRPLMEEAVFENADGTLSVAYGNAAMASSVELARYVTALEQRISQLEARI